MSISPTGNPENKRHFTRIPLDGAALLQRENERAWQGQVFDICLKGALVGLPADWRGEAGQQGKLQITLSAGAIEITMRGHITHIESVTEPDGWRIGFSWEQLDLDSATHLHRLVELNLGDTRLLQRELGELLIPR